MKAKLLLFLVTIYLSITCYAQNIDLTYYLPTGSYNPSIPTPKSVLGHEVGEWHVSHDKLVSYMYAVAAASDRVTITETGRTYENRPLLLLTVTSPENHSQIDQIKADHIKLTAPSVSQKMNTKDMPAVLYMGYSVHGNEASGSNAALLAIYYLAAAESQTVTNTLNNLVILLDPSLNPDGLNRFASWVNSHKSKNAVPDAFNREHNEAWPNGRTNHYWFDLNRDWLVAQLPESQARIAQFHAWKPNVLTDHHEMGSNSTFFFQPGIPSRNHPITPANTYKLTQDIAEFHAEALDSIGSYYYSKESFDDFYYGKGSTFPDINGAVGILFEQASARGHVKESTNGLLTFPFAIKNQFITSLSTIKATAALRKPLLDHQRDFYQSASKASLQQPVKAYVFGSPSDKVKNHMFLQILKRHQVEVYQLKKKVQAKGLNFEPATSYIVPTDQPQFRLVQAMFEKRTTFKDSLFYDVSAWTLPLAFNLPYAPLEGKAFNNSMLGSDLSNLSAPEGKIIGEDNAYAYAFEWEGYLAPKALMMLLKAGTLAKVAKKKFTTNTGKSFSNGTILIPVSTQKHSTTKLRNLLNKVSKETGVDIYALGSGNNTDGILLGSPNFEHIRTPKTAILVGKGINGYEAGEVWHLLDQRMDVPVTLLPVDVFNKENVTSKYNTLIMVNGKYPDLKTKKLGSWLRMGGTLIATKGAGKWLSDKRLSKLTYIKNEMDTTLKAPSYESFERYKGAQVIGGAIFEGRLDTSHPLGYGYSTPSISLFRNSTLFIKKPKNPFATPLVYTGSPLQSGYISDKNLEKLKNTVAIAVSTYGKGKIITFADNPNFRAFWLGTNKLFLNSIFFGNIIENDSAK